MKFVTTSSSISFESMESDLFNLVTDANKSIQQVQHLIVMRHNIKKYGDTEQFRDMVKPALEGYGICLEDSKPSMEGIISGIGNAIMKALKFLKDAVAKFFHWLMSFFRGKKAKEDLNKSKTLENEAASDKKAAETANSNPAAKSVAKTVADAAKEVNDIKVSETTSIEKEISKAEASVTEKNILALCSFLKRKLGCFATTASSSVYIHNYLVKAIDAGSHIRNGKSVSTLFPSFESINTSIDAVDVFVSVVEQCYEQTIETVEKASSKLKSNHFGLVDADRFEFDKSPWMYYFSQKKISPAMEKNNNVGQKLIQFQNNINREIAKLETLSSKLSK